MYEYYRPQLKQESKKRLRSASPNIYLAAFLFLLLSYLPTIILEWNLYPQLLQANSFDQMVEIYEYWSLNNSGMALSVATWAMQIFLVVVGFGFSRYCLSASREQETGGVPTLFGGFSQFWRILSLAILQYVFTFLWGLLLIVPGIIKAISYSQSYRILMDHPEMSALECITASRELMQGRKWDWFVLQLSFIGWAMLSGLTFGILLIWLQPYMETANAGFYNGLCGWQAEAPAEEAETPHDDRPSVDDYWKS